MKISSIETFLVHAGPPGETAWSRDTSAPGGGMSTGTSRHWLFVRVTTDSGLYGVGEGSGWPKVVETAVNDLAPLLVGEDPRDIERLWGKMHLAAMAHGIVGVIGGGALGALDMALWDIKGKALGTPVSDLLGGRIRDSLPAYAHASTPQQAQDVCAALRGVIAESLDADAAARTRVLYGGSVKSTNIASFLREPDVDGALVGGASLVVDEFAAIVRFEKHVGV